MFDIVFQWQFWAGIVTGATISVGFGLVMLSKLCSVCDGCEGQYDNPVISSTEYAKTMEALGAIVDYLEADERKHFIEADSIDGHIYPRIVQVRDYFGLSGKNVQGEVVC